MEDTTTGHDIYWLEGSKMTLRRAGDQVPHIEESGFAMWPCLALILMKGIDLPFLTSFTKNFTVSPPLTIDFPPSPTLTKAFETGGQLALSILS